MTRSVFREPEWRNKRHLLNPSKFKEYELYASGKGFLNVVNPFRNHLEIFTPIDPLTEDALHELEKKTTLQLIRKTLNPAERSLLEAHGFRLVKNWGTLLLDTASEPALDDTTRKNIRKGESRLAFAAIKDEKRFREYYDLFKTSRKALGFRTPPYRELLKVFSNPFYTVFAVEDKETHRIVAGLGTIHNDAYLQEVNAARDNKFFFANDYLKWKIIGYCKDSGIRYYDFAGCDPDPRPHTKEYNIRKYKEKWGGTFHHVYHFTR